MTRREPVMVLLLTLVTCGIYGIYWILVNNKDARDNEGFDGPSGIVLLLLTIVTCGIYMLYWRYKVTQHVGSSDDASKVLLYSLLGFIPFVGFVFMLLAIVKMQNVFNEAA